MTNAATPRIIPFPMPAPSERVPARNDLSASTACLSAALNCLSTALADQQAAFQPRNTFVEGQAALKAEPGPDNIFK